MRGSENFRKTIILNHNIFVSNVELQLNQKVEKAVMKMRKRWEQVILLPLLKSDASQL